MPRRVLPLTTVADGYTYFSCPRTSYLSIQVFNAGIDIGFGDYLGAGGALGAGVYPPVDEYLALSNANWPRACDEIRFKNHVAGTPAQVQITAQGQADLPGDTPLGVSNEPNFLTLNSDGSVGANFSGHVHAAGLDLDAGTTTTPPNQDRIRWLRTSDGAVVADIYAYEDGSGNRASFLETVPSVGTVRSDTFLQASAIDNSSAAIHVKAGPGLLPSAFVEVTGAGGGIPIWQGDGSSRFAQISDGFHGSQIWSGAVVGGTGAVRLNGTKGWTTTRTAVGTYSLFLTLTSILPGIWPIPIIQCNESAGAIAELDYISLTSVLATFTIKTFSGPFSFGLADINWSFAAIACQN